MPQIQSPLTPSAHRRMCSPWHCASPTVSTRLEREVPREVHHDDVARGEAAQETAGAVPSTLVALTRRPSLRESC
jgi:hypothetical protein